MFQPIPLLARLAADAPGMTMGTAVFLLSLHSPVEAAEATATLDIIASGKFAFGVGQGYRDTEFASFGIPKANRGERMAEAVKVIRMLWAEDNVTWDGEYFQLPGSDDQSQAGPAARPAHLDGGRHSQGSWQGSRNR